jgi:cellulose synthase/poly-beta-1,6-N-acetylglucosamine synthase-like glycosyltransferase
MIPARNESNNIAACVNSILAQDYPADLFEIIVIDDHSTDDTADVVKRIAASNLKCITLKDFLQPGEETIAYKKKALAAGISVSKGELIITTDADCIAAPYWLKNIAAVYEQEQPVIIVAPVDYTTNGSVVEVFQSLDFMSMQGITVAAHQLGMGNMSNGANFAFSASAFKAVKGYEGVDNMASGDDYLLMMKLQQAFPGRASYVKTEDAIIRTAPQPTWGSFLQQRIRWASKSGKYDDKRMTTVLLLVYLFNVSLLVVFLSAFFYPVLWWVLLGALIVKTEIELYYLYPVSSFFHKRKQLIIFPLLQPLHILYIVSAGLLGFIGVYRWKGRRVK